MPGPVIVRWIGVLAVQNAGQERDPMEVLLENKTSVVSGSSNGISPWHRPNSASHVRSYFSALVVSWVIESTLWLLQ
jgi:hypothetical protein